jgi:hypothetical protein
MDNAKCSISTVAFLALKHAALLVVVISTYGFYFCRTLKIVAKILKMDFSDVNKISLKLIHFKSIFFNSCYNKLFSLNILEYLQYNVEN